MQKKLFNIFWNKIGHSCSWVKSGQFTTKKKCCVWKEKCLVGKCKRVGKHCRTVGKPRTVEPKSKCEWIENGKTKRRRCCFWVTKCVGSDCKTTDSHCEFVGKALREKNGCKWRLLKGGARRKVCCRGKAGHKTCKKGPIISRTIENLCHWKKVSKGCQRRQCCQYNKRCENDKCVTKLHRCAFRSQVVCTRPHKKCFFKKNFSILLKIIMLYWT